MPMAEQSPAPDLACDTKNHHEHKLSGGTSPDQLQSYVQLTKEEMSVKPDPNTDDGHSGTSLHRHTNSLHVNWTLAEVTRLAKEVYDETIAEVHLSLFGYWIRENDEHYQLAKQHIRELALDQVGFKWNIQEVKPRLADNILQGYNVERIDNVNLRKLLRDVHDIRPKEPPHSTTARLHNIMMTAKRGSARKLRSASSPVTTRPDTASSLTLGENGCSSWASFLSYPWQDYPPDTPDRPAPLSLKSRSSKTSTDSPLMTEFHRSVSSPLHNSYLTKPVWHWSPPTSSMLEDVASQPLSPSPRSVLVKGIGVTDTDDVFGIVEKSLICQGDDFNDVFTVEKGINYNLSRRCASGDSSRYHPVGQYELHTMDAFSDISFDTEENNHDRQIHEAVNDRISEGNYISKNTSCEANRAPAASNDVSFLERASRATNAGRQIRYNYAASSSSPETMNAELAPTSLQMPFCIRSLHNTNEPFSGSDTAECVQTLSLRPHESETLFNSRLTIRKDFDHNRAFSMKQNIMRSHRPPPLTISPLPLPQSTSLPSQYSLTRTPATRLPRRTISGTNSDFQPHSFQCDIPPDVEHGRDSISSDILTKDRIRSISRPSSIASTLTAFPIPSMNSPVGELPMSVNRATLLPQNNDTSNDVSVAYRAISEAHITQLLQRTRHQGAQLSLVDWDALGLFERAWREANGHLLISIYGRRDVTLSSQDVQYVECISRELRDDSYASDWVRNLFHTKV